jgi:asparagine synthetase B (glutamine-hydrolysing)
MLKKLLKEAIHESIKDSKDVALLFSGGTDSLTCLFSLFEMDIKPTLYTFYLEGKPNRDLEYSKKVAEFYSLEHTIIEIPYSLSKLEESVLYITENLPVDRKTNVQCVFPFLYVMPQVKEKYVVSGLCADDLYGSAKSVIIKASKNKEVFDSIREKTRSSLNSSAYLPIKQFIEQTHGKVFITPYREQEVHDFFMEKSWAELNKPKQKQIAIDAFSSYFEEQDIYRKNSNLQVESGIREYHNELINSELNENNRRRVDEIYKDLIKGFHK